MFPVQQLLTPSPSYVLPFRPGNKQERRDYHRSQHRSTRQCSGYSKRKKEEKRTATNPRRAFPPRHRRRQRLFPRRPPTNLTRAARGPCGPPRCPRPPRTRRPTQSAGCLVMEASQPTAAPPRPHRRAGTRLRPRGRRPRVASKQRRRGRRRPRRGLPRLLRKPLKARTRPPAPSLPSRWRFPCQVFPS